MKEETCYLWISELPPNATQQTLADLFSSYGCVSTTRIHEAGNLRGAVLSFLDTNTAAKACAASHLLNGQSLISEYCDQSGEPGLQRLKDLANRKCSDKSLLENGSTSVNNNNSPPIRAQVGKQEGGKLKVLKVWNFPERSTDSSIQSGLYHEYRKVGKVSSIQVRGEKDDRHAMIVFKRAEDAESAYELTKSGKSLFGMTLNVERATDETVEPGAGVDEYHVRASRTLLVGSIEAGVSETELKEALTVCGTVLDVELKPDGPAQAIVQFADIRGAAAALRLPEGLTLGGHRARLSFGRSQPTNCVWLANLAATVTEPLLSKTFACHGRLREVCVNSHRQCALVFFDEVEDARRAVVATKGGCLAGQRLLVDFASQLCQKHFVDELVTSGQCSSNYKLFEQLFAPELHRGIIPSPKAAARYREMMLEYVKARSHRSWHKVRDCRTDDTSPSRESSMPSDPAEQRAQLDTRRRLASGGGGGGGGVRRKSGHSSDGDVSKEGQEREQRLLARLSGFEDARSECSEIETSGSIADQTGAVSDTDRASAPAWQRKTSRSPAAAPPHTRRTPGNSGPDAGGVSPVSPQPAGSAASDQDAMCLEQAVSAYEAALGTNAPLIGLFDCPSPSAATGSEANPTAVTGEDEAHSSSTMPTPPDTESVSPTPPIRRAPLTKRRRQSESDESDFGEALDRQPSVSAFQDGAAWLQPYESMYDKIKRRQTSRTISTTDVGRMARSSDSRRPEEAHQTSRKRPRPRPSTASRQHSAADQSVTDSEEEATPTESTAQSLLPATRPRKAQPVGGGSMRSRGRKSTTSSDAGAVGGADPRRRGSATAAKAPATKRQHRSSKSGKPSRSKMSVDSVFGSSSESEEAAAPATPSTVAMTDSSRAESTVDPGSPPASSRLTDIFAEAKAQLDPRAVTEKSLFAFSDDETFEPAPDLPTIDRFQPDAAAPSPDRPENAEPPKLAAAHADLETTAAHALAQLSQRPPAITLAQPQFRVPELTLRPLIPAPPPPLPPAHSAAPETALILHPPGPSVQSTRPPMQPAAQQDLDQFVQDVIRKVQAAPTNQTASWDHRQPVGGEMIAATIPTPVSASVGSDSTPTQQTISLTGGLAQRPVKRSPPAMEALALQHVDDVIRDVVDGHVDLSPYMERGRLRFPSGERFAPTPVPSATTPVRPPSAAQLALPLPPSSLPSGAHQPQPTPVTTAPELRLQPFAICPVTSAAAGTETSATSLAQTIAVTSVPTTSMTTESSGDANFTQRLQQQQQSQQQVQLQALYMQLLSGRYPQDMLYSHYVPQLQLFQSTSAQPQPPQSQSQVQQQPQPHVPSQSQAQVQSQPPAQVVPQSQVQPPAPVLPQSQVQPQSQSAIAPEQPVQPSQAPAQSSHLDTLLRKYPVKWQGRLALKNDEAGVQMHFVRGSDTLAKAALELAAPDAARVLKVAQRMRLEPAQLEGVQRKMADEAEFCVLLAVACGVNAQDYRHQTHNLREAFIKYLQEKQAAGIVNVNYPGQEVPAYVVHIFPPGQFATSKLQQYACDLYANLFPQPSSETPHLLVVVTTV